MDAKSVLAGVRELSARFAQERSSRQSRRALEQSDFDRLRQAGVHLAGVPAELGGLWEDAARSTRPICALLRSLAAGDASLALVMAMHPTVLSFWLTTPQARELLAGFLGASLRRGLRCVRVIHGKGLRSKNREPVLKNKVARWLMQRQEVLAYCQARRTEGGGGAVMVLLKAR